MKMREIIDKVVLRLRWDFDNFYTNRQIFALAGWYHHTTHVCCPFPRSSPISYCSPCCVSVGVVTALVIGETR